MPAEPDVTAEGPATLRRVRRFLPHSHQFFEEGNVERELLAQQGPRTLSKEDEEKLLKEVAQIAEIPTNLSLRPECSICHRRLPTEHLLSLHLSEAHDSFFAAQAAKKLCVFECLVEGCGKKFCGPQQRKQHLRDVHCFPKGFDFEKMHLGVRKEQIRPPRVHRNDTRAEPSAMEIEHADPDERTQMEVDELGDALSKLSTAEACIPRQVMFGRRGRGMYIPKVKGRSRGRGRGRSKSTQ